MDVFSDVSTCVTLKSMPGDEFSLPNIVMMVNATTGHSMFFLMDGFRACYHIMMDPLDVEETCLLDSHG